MIGKIPEHLKASIDRYVERGIPAGGFLQACIENDLKEAIARGDEENLAALPDIVRYLYNDCPGGCWGFKGAMKQWQESLRQKNANPTGRGSYESYETTDHGDSVWPK